MTTEITDDKLNAICRTGAEFLDHVVESMESKGLDKDNIIGVLAIAVAGALKMTGIDIETFSKGLELSEPFWQNVEGTIQYAQPLEPGLAN